MQVSEIVDAVPLFAIGAHGELAKIFELMEEHMPTPSGNKIVKTPKTVAGSVSERLEELSIALPAPPTPLGAYVESSDTGDLLFLSGMLPVVHGNLAISGRLGEKVSVKEGQEAACIASVNALAAAKRHLGTLDRLKKLVKLTVLVATTGKFISSTRVASPTVVRQICFCSTIRIRGWPHSFGLWSAEFAYRYTRHS